MRETSVLGNSTCDAMPLDTVEIYKIQIAANVEVNPDCNDHYLVACLQYDLWQQALDESNHPLQLQRIGCGASPLTGLPQASLAAQIQTSDCASNSAESVLQDMHSCVFCVY